MFLVYRIYDYILKLIDGQKMLMVTNLLVRQKWRIEDNLNTVKVPVLNSTYEGKTKPK